MPDSKDALKNSILALKGAYLVIIGLALQKGVILFITPQQGGEILSIMPPLTLWVFFLVLLITLIRFLHGAIRHLDYVYVEKPEILKKPGSSAIVDFVLFFIEGILFVILSHLQASPRTFIITYIILFLIDIIWVQASLWLLKRWEGSHLTTWRNNNAIAILAFVALYMLWPCVDERHQAVTLPLVFFFIFALNTVMDYKVQWTFYFPTNQSD